VEANQIVLPAGERELVLARKYLRLSWTALRAEAREKFALIHARAWDLETDLRAKDADSRRAFRRERLAAIRLLAAHDRSEARALLAWDLANLYRKQRSAAALRWKVRRKVLEAEVPNFNTSFLEFVRRRAAVGEERAIKVRRDHMARGLVATEQGTSALHQRLVLLSRRSATASPNRIVRPITHRGPSKT
jgi:hypothetical protein